MEKGCVYFFRHIGLTPIKIGYSENNSPIDRFNQFKTYAPYGSEIVGFIQCYDASNLERKLHSKYSSKRLNGEWFEITEEEVMTEINFHSNIEDVKERNEFQIAWANKLMSDKNNVKNEVKAVVEKDKKTMFKIYYNENKNINRTKIAEKLSVTRKTIHNWINELQTQIK